MSAVDPKQADVPKDIKSRYMLNSDVQIGYPETFLQ